MNMQPRFGAIALLLFIATAAWPDAVNRQNGGDQFIAGKAVTDTIDASGDAFVAGRTAAARGTAEGDLHVAGFDVSVSADTAQDLYAAGFSVDVRSRVAEDLTAVGFSVQTEPGSEIGGNARLFGSTVTVEGAIGGALTATGADIVLNGDIAGDVALVAGTISFGPDARIGGTLTYSSDREITIPERVIPSSRVSFERIEMRDARDAWDDMRREMPILPGVMTMFYAFLVTLLFFLLLGAVALGFLPERTEAMRARVIAAPGQSVLLGVVGLSVLLGFIPIMAMTIVGILFIPFAVLGIIVVWTLGYALGTYSIAMRLWTGFGGAVEPGTLVRLVVFGAAITFVALFNFIPFVGWVVNYTLVLLGTGGLTRAVLTPLIGHPVLAGDAEGQQASG